MNKKEVAHILEEIGTILDLKGENPFKVRAYYNGARIVETLDKDLADLVKTREIAEIKGIGKALAEKISTLVNEGSLPFYGLFHVHTTYSDGANSLKEIADACKSVSAGS